MLRVVAGVSRLVEAWLRSSPERGAASTRTGDEANAMGRRRSPAVELLLLVACWDAGSGGWWGEALCVSHHNRRHERYLGSGVSW